MTQTVITSGGRDSRVNPVIYGRRQLAGRAQAARGGRRPRGAGQAGRRPGAISRRAIAQRAIHRVRPIGRRDDRVTPASHDPTLEPHR